MHQQPGQRLGQGFWVAFWILLLISLGLLFDHWNRGLTHPNQQLQVRTTEAGAALVLKPNRQGHYLFAGAINGQRVVFMIDTGASDVVVPGGLARELGLEGRGDYVAQTANGTVRVARTRIDRLRLGPLELRDVPATINAHMGGEVLLGMSALKHLELRQAGGELTLMQPTPRP